MKKFDKNKLEVEDVFYGVQERNLAFSRTKIYREIDGEDWFKYTTPLRSYEIVEYKVRGIVKKTLEGNWPDSDLCELDNQFYVQSIDNTHVKNYVTDLDYDEYFLDKEDAMVYLMIKEKEARDLDKQ
jgi:hypothetical protein